MPECDFREEGCNNFDAGGIRLCGVCNLATVELVRYAGKLQAEGRIPLNLGKTPFLNVQNRILALTILDTNYPTRQAHRRRVAWITEGKLYPMT